jgi:RNA recognition motif-containing protein
MGNRLFVGNLSFNTTEESLMAAFQEFGEVVEARLMTERETGRSRGFAFVEMATPEAATKAIEEMNGAVLDGRPLRVNEAEKRPERGGGGGGFRGGGGGGGRGGDRGGGRGGDRGGRRNDRGGNRW